MKRCTRVRWSRRTIILGLLGSWPGQAWAQSSSKGLEFIPTVGSVFYLNRLGSVELEQQGVVGVGVLQAKDDILLGARVGYNFTNHWAVEAGFGHNPSTFEATVSVANQPTQSLEFNVSVFLYSLNLRVHPLWGSHRFFSPYLTGGVGGIIYNPQEEGEETETDFAGNWGVGLSLRFGDRTALRADLRDYLSTFTPTLMSARPGAQVSSKTQHDLVLQVGWAIGF